MLGTATGSDDQCLSGVALTPSSSATSAFVVELAEILAFVPDGGDDSNDLPISFLRFDSEHNRRGESVFELLSWLSADPDKFTQMVSVPILCYLTFRTITSWTVEPSANSSGMPGSR